MLGKKSKKFCRQLEGHWQKEQDPDPDPLVRGTDPRIQNRNKMSRIRNNALQKQKFQQQEKIKLWRYFLKYNDSKIQIKEAKIVDCLFLSSCCLCFSISCLHCSSNLCNAA